MKRIEYLTAVKRYGEIDLARKHWPNAEKWMTTLRIPEHISDGWVNTATGADTTRIYCNRDMAPALLLALQHVYDQGMLSELHSFDGCFNIRAVRGVPGRVSAHAYGLAVDINAAENPLGGPVRVSPTFVKCFKDAGLDWGGDFDRVDGMHFSYAWEGKP